MKKAILLLVFIQLFIVSSAFGAAITDTVKPLGDMKYSVTVEDNFIFERDLDANSGEVSDTNQAYGKLAIGLTDYFNVYTKLGATSGTKYKKVKGSYYEYETDVGFLWGIGASGAYEIVENWKIAGDVQFNSWTIDVDAGRYAGEAISNISNPEVNNYELQVMGLITTDYELPAFNTVLHPYVGVGYLYFNTETDSTLSYSTSGTSSVTDTWDMEGDDVISLVAGLTATVMENWKVSVEGRFIGEFAISTGLTYAF